MNLGVDADLPIGARLIAKNTRTERSLARLGWRSERHVGVLARWVSSRSERDSVAF